LLVVVKLSVQGPAPKVSAPAPSTPPAIVGFWRPRTPLNCSQSHVRPNVSKP